MKKTKTAQRHFFVYTMNKEAVESVEQAAKGLEDGKEEDAVVCLCFRYYCVDTDRNRLFYRGGK